MTILANGGRNLNDRGTSKGGNLERVQLGGVTSTIQVENLGGKKVIVNRTRSLCSNTSLMKINHRGACTPKYLLTRPFHFKFLANA